MGSVLAAVFIIVFIGLFAGLIAWAARMSKRTANNLRQMAATLGLTYTGQPPSLGMFYTQARAEGPLRGKQVALFPFFTGSGKSRTQWCAVSATVPVACSLTFHLRRQGWGTKVMEVFGAREIQIGDAEFDRGWFIQTNQPEFFREALLPELREKVQALVRGADTSARGVELRLDKGVVRYAEIGSFASAASCQRCLRAADVVCDLADLAEVAAEQKTGG